MIHSKVPPEPIVRMVGITKSFIGTHAVRNVDLDFLPGEVHGLVGENGAGKSTLMKVLAGMYSDYSGEIFVNGRSTRIHTPRIARELGIAMVHQELSLVPDLSVAENMFLGREARSKIPALINRRRVAEEARSVLAEIEAGISSRSLNVLGTAGEAGAITAQYRACVRNTASPREVVDEVRLNLDQFQTRIDPGLWQALKDEQLLRTDAPTP